MKTTQEELKDRGYYARKASTGDNDIDICRISDFAEDAPIAHIAYVEILQRNTAQEKLDFILSKLPKNE